MGCEDRPAVPARLRLLLGVARPAGLAYCGLAGARRRTVAHELALVCGDRGAQFVRAATRESFVFHAKKLCDSLCFGGFTREVIDRMVAVEGLEHLDAALARGKGALVLLSHFGSHLLPILALAYRGYDVRQLTGPPRGGVTRQGIFRLRRYLYRRLPITFLRSDQSLGAAVRALRHNGVVAVAFDGRVGEKWVRVPMFGREANVAPGPMRIAAATGAALLPTIIVRNPDDTHTVVIGEPLSPAGSARDEGCIARVAAEAARFFEGYIRRYPAHYGMVLATMRERALAGRIPRALLD